VPTDLNLFLEPVNPGVGTDGRVVYEVAPDASGFTLTLDDVEMMEDKSAVFDLGNLSFAGLRPRERVGLCVGLRITGSRVVNGTRAGAQGRVTCAWSSYSGRVSPWRIGTARTAGKS
jgi:hypothetical protein